VSAATKGVHLQPDRLAVAVGYLLRVEGGGRDRLRRHRDGVLPDELRSAGRLGRRRGAGIEDRVSASDVLFRSADGQLGLEASGEGLAPLEHERAVQEQQ
jgi:hypothetical protein